jgi:hypothetical protein
VVKSFSKTPAIIINIELVTLFNLILVHICWHSRLVRFQKKKVYKKNSKILRNRGVLLVMNYCKNHHKNGNFHIVINGVTYIETGDFRGKIDIASVKKIIAGAGVKPLCSAVQC